MLTLACTAHCRLIYAYVGTTAICFASIHSGLLFDAKWNLGRAFGRVWFLGPSCLWVRAGIKQTLTVGSSP